MNKKQLTLQNSSLFAELERKTKEIDILTIRLKDANKKIDELSIENEDLKVFATQVKSKNDELNAEIEGLKKALDEAESKAAQNFEVLGGSDAEPTCEESESNAEIISDKGGVTAEEIFETFYGEDKNADHISTEPSNGSTENPEEKSLPVSDTAQEDEQTDTADREDAGDFAELPTTENTLSITSNANTNATSDLVRDYGAKIIGKVTRVTAEVISKVSANNTDASESLKTLALGKNESFKFQIMELAKAKGEPEKIMAEMDLLADEAIVYLRSI